MPYRRKDSPIYWASFTGPGGQRVRRSTGTTVRKEAAALEAKWKLESYRETQWDEQPLHRFEEMLLGYLNATQLQKRSPDRDRVIARHLRGHFAGKFAEELAVADVRSYIEQRRTAGIRSTTINRELAMLSAVINFACREWEWNVPNPVTGRKLKQSAGRVRWISVAEATTLIQIAESEPRAPHLGDFIELALNTGCRKQEILGLEWRRVDLGAKLMHLEARHTKSHKRRSIPLNESACAVMERRRHWREAHCPESPWVFCNREGRRLGDVKKSFSTALKRADLSDFRIHDLRHTCAAWLVTAGVPLPEVRDLLGHSTVVMTERYAHLAPENVRAAVARLDGRLSRSGHVARARQGRERD